MLPGTGANAFPAGFDPKPAPFGVIGALAGGIKTNEASTTLLMIAIVLAGFVAYRQLPISALPQVDFVMAYAHPGDHDPHIALLQSFRAMVTGSLAPNREAR